MRTLGIMRSMKRRTSFTKISSPVISSAASHYATMLKATLKWMNSELDRYIGETEEVPWFYNERAVLGFFISGLVRNGNATVLQEFCCFKNTKQEKKETLGRADLYFNLHKVDYLVESKWCWTSVKKRSAIVAAVKRARKAWYQAKTYAKDARVPEGTIFSLCFEAIAFKENDLSHDYRKSINLWRIKGIDALGGLDFYSLIEVTSNVEHKWHYYDNLYFPALAVYGVFNR